MSIIPGIPDTTITIEEISNPPDKPKGDHIPITTFKVKNAGSEPAVGLVIEFKVKSIGAGNYLTVPFRNYAGNIVLHSSKEVLGIFEYIAPQQIIEFTYNIPSYGYTNGAMNLGIWKIVEVKAYAYNSPVVVKGENDPNPIISNPEFKVTAKSQFNGPHAVFIYYLWNSGGAGFDWGGDNPKNYFVNGYGSVKAGLWRFSTFDSNIPVLINPIIACDDPTWSIPTGMDTSAEFRANGETHIEGVDRLNTEWYPTNGLTHRYNCGFDIILMCAGRSADVAGTAGGNIALANKCRPGMPDNSAWRDNIDGTVQHEVSHLFGCNDVVDGHDTTECIMAYYGFQFGFGYIFITHIHEHDVTQWTFPTNNWCTHTGVDNCQYQFLDNWNQYHTIA